MTKSPSPSVDEVATSPEVQALLDIHKELLSARADDRFIDPRSHAWVWAGTILDAATKLERLERRAASLVSPPKAGSGEIAWACVKCNSPRSIDPCPKCGTPLTKPAEGWDWPELPDIDRIRALAREVGYAIGVHGSLERDLDLIAAPWVESAIGPYGLALHIAAGLGGEVVDFKNQDKPCGRWSCNIHTPDWTKMIDLSVMPPVANHEARGDGVRVTDEMRSLSKLLVYSFEDDPGTLVLSYDGEKLASIDLDSEAGSAVLKLEQELSAIRSLSNPGDGE